MSWSFSVPTIIFGILYPIVFIITIAVQKFNPWIYLPMSFWLFIGISLLIIDLVVEYRKKYHLIPISEENLEII